MKGSIWRPAGIIQYAKFSNDIINYGYSMKNENSGINNNKKQLVDCNMRTCAFLLCPKPSVTPVFHQTKIKSNGIFLIYRRWDVL